MKRVNPKVLYIMGPAYTGSTMFGLALGRHSKVINLGEIINLEHDHQPKAKCTCGATLDNCTFWSKTSRSLEARSSGSSDPWNFSTKSRHKIDGRGGLIKIWLVLFGVFNTYSKRTISEYLSKQEILCDHITETFSSTENLYILDLSKTPERLEILLSSKNMDIKCIKLHRDSRSVFASIMKRPKRIKSIIPFKSLRESFWLMLRRCYNERVYAKLPPDCRMEVDWEEFTSSPRQILNDITEWLGLECNLSTEEDIRKVDITEQHVYVGNRWLFREGLHEAYIRKKEHRAPLALGQKIAFILFNGR